MKLLKLRTLIFVFSVVATPLLFAQSTQPMAPTQQPAPAPQPAPGVKPAQVFKAADIQAALDKLVPAAKATGSGGAVFGDYGSHAINLSLRHSSGGAEIHLHKDDVFFVTRGSATLITGGKVIDPKEGAGGEIKGTRIEGGVTQTIHAGDVIHVPAGTPHQLILAVGEEFGAVVVKIKE